jgi:hypothetical protein
VSIRGFCFFLLNLVDLSFLAALMATTNLNLAPVSAGLTNELRDIKPPVDIPSGWAWLWWTLGVLVVATVLFFAWRSWRKRRALVPLTPPVPAHVRAKQKLQEALALINQPRPFCILVSDTVRQYLEERFDFRAPERTTEEFLHELQATNLLTPEQKRSLGDFLNRCDLVKFARYEPHEPELHDLHNSALRLVEETEPALMALHVAQASAGAGTAPPKPGLMQPLPPSK